MDRLTHVETFASELIKEYVPSFNFQFTNSKTTFGVCRYYRKTIGLSKYHALHSNDDAIIDTILHEIAHALVGAGNGHNNVWKRKCVEIGAKPQRCGDGHIPNTGNKYAFHCSTCNVSHPRHRKPRRITGYRCSKCKTPVVFQVVGEDEL